MGRAESEETESYFADYLLERGVPHEYEKAAGSSFPDYWLTTRHGAVVCEVHRIRKSLYERPSGVGAIDPYPPIRKAVKRKAPQGKSLRGAIPYVVVLHAPGWPADEVSVPGALFGGIQVVMPFDGESARAEDAHYEFGRNAELHRDQHPHVSAVAVLKRFNPTLRAVQDEVDELLDHQRGDVERSLSVGIEAFRRRTEDGTYIEDARRTRLVVYHNLYATTPLPTDVLAGPFDEQFSTVGGVYNRISQGIETPRLPS
jgi:hypothetical protein